MWVRPGSSDRTSFDPTRWMVQVGPLRRRLWRSQTVAPLTIPIPTAMPAMAPAGISPPFGRWTVVGELVGEVAKATTWLAEVATRTPFPVLGVGKWLVGTPIDACCFTAPVLGSSP